MNDRNNDVLYATEGCIAMITLNRPAKRNALNESVIRGLSRALHNADSDKNIRAAVLTGAGSDFCAGADLAALQEISSNSVTDNLDDAGRLADLFALIRRIRVPVVAAVRGRALAGGSGLATSCDIILAARSARFGYPEVKIGFVPAMVMAILRRNISEKRAFELIGRGEAISADEAERIGLINRVFDDDTFEADVEQFLHGFEKLSPSAMMLAKRLLYHMDGMSFDASLRAGADMNAIARMTEDCRTGIDRFLYKK